MTREQNTSSRSCIASLRLDFDYQTRMIRTRNTSNLRQPSRERSSSQACVRRPHLVVIIVQLKPTHLLFSSNDIAAFSGTSQNRAPSSTRTLIQINEAFTFLRIIARLVAVTARRSPLLMSCSAFSMTRHHDSHARGQKGEIPVCKFVWT
jgi:hypothetical protein